MIGCGGSELLTEAQHDQVRCRRKLVTAMAIHCRNFEPPWQVCDFVEAVSRACMEVSFPKLAA